MEGNPVGGVDPWGLQNYGLDRTPVNIARNDYNYSSTDVEFIVKTSKSVIEYMNKNGERKGGMTENMVARLQATFDSGSNLLGCTGQANEMADSLRVIQPYLQDEWQIQRENAGLLHSWVRMTSDNPRNPDIISDPSGNLTAPVPKGSFYPDPGNPAFQHAKY